MTSAVIYPEFPNPARTDCVDAAMMYAYTDYQSVVDCGYGGMSMYVGGTYGVSRRNIEAAWAVGLWVMLNFERASNAYVGGASAGNAHATLALQQATDLGWLKESPIIFSATDTNIPSGDVPTAHAYYQAMVDVFHANGAQGGAYGPPAYLRQLAAQPWWPDDFPMWQWAGFGQVESWTWIKQVFTPVHAGISRIPFSIDENHLYKPMLVWTGYGPDDPPDPPEVDMAARWFVTNKENYPPFTTPDGTHYSGSNPDGSFPPGNVVWEIQAGGKRHVTAGEWGGVTQSSRGDFTKFFDWSSETTGWLQGVPDVPTSDQSAVLAAVNGVQGSVSAVGAQVAALPTPPTKFIADI